MKKNRYSLLAILPFAVLTAKAQVPASATFNFTGSMQTFTVPCGVDTVFVQTWGAQGGSGAVGGSSGGPTSGGSGGLGGYAEGFLLVTPGDVLNVFVGGQGATPTGGFNGGANGGSTNAGGGGGASDVRVGGTAEANRVITAGGGGGGGRGGCESGTGIVGGGGGAGGSSLAATNGVDAPTSGGSAGGGKGGNFGNVQGASGGAGVGCAGFLGVAGSTATTGTGGSGGAGQSCCCFTFGSIPAGGGGGGGFLGGGGGGGGSAGTTGCSGNDKGAGGGGGGGSSDISGVLNGATNAGIWLGNGMVGFSWTDPVPPAHTITGVSSLCQGDATNYAIGADAYSTFYTWTVPVGITFNSGQNTTSINVTGGTPGTYTIYVQGVNGTCSLSGPVDSIMVTVNPNPTVAASSNPTTICAGDSAVLTATGADTYLWSTSGTGSSITVIPTTTTTYTVTGTESLHGCFSTSTTTVTVNPLPVVSASSSTSAICTGFSSSLVGSGAASYVWMPGSLTGSPITVTPTTTTTYTVTGTDSSGCSNTAMTTITVNPLPTVAMTSPSTVCVGDGNYTLTGSPSGGTFSGTGVSGSSFSPSTAGTGTFTLTYTYTDGNGCMNTDNNSITVSACTGIDDPKNIFGLAFMPNPVSDLLQIRWDGNKGNVSLIEVFDINGRLMISQQVNNATNAEVKVAALPAGNYNLTVTAETGRASYRFVKK